MALLGRPKLAVNKEIHKLNVFNNVLFVMKGLSRVISGRFWVMNGMTPAGEARKEKLL